MLGSVLRGGEGVFEKFLRHTFLICSDWAHTMGGYSSKAHHPTRNIALQSLRLMSNNALYSTAKNPAATSGNILQEELQLGRADCLRI